MSFPNKIKLKKYGDKYEWGFIHELIIYLQKGLWKHLKKREVKINVIFSCVHQNRTSQILNTGTSDNVTSC